MSEHTGERNYRLHPLTPLELVELDIESLARMARWIKQAYEAGDVDEFNQWTSGIITRAVSLRDSLHAINAKRAESRKAAA